MFCGANVTLASENELMFYYPDRYTMLRFANITRVARHKIYLYTSPDTEAGQDYPLGTICTVPMAYEEVTLEAINVTYEIK